MPYVTLDVCSSDVLMHGTLCGWKFVYTINKALALSTRVIPPEIFSSLKLFTFSTHENLITGFILYSKLGQSQMYIFAGIEKRVPPRCLTFSKQATGSVSTT